MGLESFTIKDSIYFFTGGAYTPGEEACKEYMSLLNPMIGTAGITPSSWSYFIGFVLENPEGVTSSTYLQRKNWILSQEVTKTFVKYRQGQSTYLPRLIEQELNELLSIIDNTPLLYLTHKYKEILLLEACKRKDLEWDFNSFDKEIIQLTWYGVPEYQKVLTELKGYYNA